MKKRINNIDKASKGNENKTSYRWQKVSSNIGGGWRDGVGALTYDNKMWLLGGWGHPTYGTKHCGNDVWNSKNGVDWTLVKPNTFVEGIYNPQTDWEGRHTAGYVVYDDKMWIIGGDPLQGHYQNDVWSSSDGINWIHINKDNPLPWKDRVLHYTLVFDDKIWVMGGQKMPNYAGGSDEALYNDIWNSTDGTNWTKVETLGPIWKPRGMIGGSVVLRDRMWIIGGGTYDTPENPKRNYYNDVWSSDNGINWKKHIDCKDCPWEPRSYHNVIEFDGKIWLFGGCNSNLPGKYSNNRNDVWYSEDGEKWIEMTHIPWVERHAASVFCHENAIWLVAGNIVSPEDGSLLAPDAWKLIKI